MKKSLLLLLSLLVTSTMFAGVIKITPTETKAANSSTSYVTTEFDVTVDGYMFCFKQLNPSTGQMRVKNTGASAFNLYNKTAVERLKSVTIKADATTLGTMYMKVGENTITGNATTSDIKGVVSGKTVTFTVPENTEVQYFHINLTTKGSGTVKFTEILVEYADNDPRQESGLAFPQKEYTVNLGEEFESPVATAFEGAEIEYSIDNEKVATIDAQSGKVTIVGDGTATVSAISKETEEYKEGVAEYVLNVIDPNNLSFTFDFRSSQSGTEFKEGLISAKFEQGTNENNPPQWYSTGTAMRLYGGNTLTLSAPQGYYISSVEFTTDTKSTTEPKNRIFNEGTTVKIAGKSTSLASLDGLTWTAGEKEVVNAITIKNGGSSGHIRIQTITVNLATAFNPYSEEELTPAYVNADYFDNVPLDKDGKGTIKVNNGELKGVVLYFKHEAAADETETMIRTAEHEGFAEGTHNEDAGTHEFEVPSRGTISYYGYHTASGVKGVVREVKADLETGVEDVVADNESEVKYFNLNGVQVNGELVPGVYVRIKGDKAEKVLVK